MQLDWVKEIIAKNSQEKYGVDHHFKSPIVVDMIKQTKFERYGDETYNNREKTRETILKKYGVDHYSKTDEYKEKTKNTMMERYGVENYTQTE